MANFADGWMTDNTHLVDARTPNKHRETAAKQPQNSNPAHDAAKDLLSWAAEQPRSGNHRPRAAEQKLTDLNKSMDVRPTRAQGRPTGGQTGEWKEKRASCMVLWWNEEHQQQPEKQFCSRSPLGVARCPATCIVVMCAFLVTSNA